MHVGLDRVLLRDPTLSPEEILMSESQERMMRGRASPTTSTRSSRSARSGTSRPSSSARSPTPAGSTIDWHGERIVDVPPRTVAHEGPVYERPFARPAWQDALQADAPDSLARPQTPDELREPRCCAWSRAPNLAVKSWITDQYDRYVLGNTVLAQPEDAGMIRIDEETGLGVAVVHRLQRPLRASSTRTPVRSSRSPRPTATSRPPGAVPLAVTDCLNFGSPEDPDVMWQFARGRDAAWPTAASSSGIPVTGGNVSFYNQTGDAAILPTPVVGVLGVIDDVARRTPMAWGARRRRRSTCSATRATSSRAASGRTSCTATSAACRRASTSRAERRSAEILVAGSRDGMLTAAHDVSDGGLAQTLVEMALRSGVGARMLRARRPRPVRASCSPSRRRARSSSCPRARSCGSPRCAPPGQLPAHASVWSTRARIAGARPSPAPRCSTSRSTNSPCRATQGRDPGRARRSALSSDRARDLKAAVKASLTATAGASARPGGRGADPAVSPQSRWWPGTRIDAGTPSAVVETDAETWLALASGALSWAEAVASGRLRGERRAQRPQPAYLPLLGRRNDGFRRQTHDSVTICAVRGRSPCSDTADRDRSAPIVRRGGGADGRESRMTDASVAIRLRGLTRTFGDVTAVDGVDLDVVDGEFLTLLGPSGSGKTTVLRMIAGFERPDAGTIQLAGGGRHRSARRSSATSTPCSRTTRCSRT